MRTCTINGCTAPLLDLNIGPFLQDSRVSQVEHTLEILIKSRHGNEAFVRRLGRYVISQFYAAREVCMDLNQKQAAIPFVRRAFRSVIDAVRKGVCIGFQIIRNWIATSTNVLVAAASPKSPPNLSRGSPCEKRRTETNPGNQKMIPDYKNSPLPRNQKTPVPNRSLKTQGTIFRSEKMVLSSARSEIFIETELCADQSSVGAT